MNRRKDLLANHKARTIVYFIQHGNTDGLIKIGYSGNIPQRIKHIEALSPLPITLLGWMPGGASKEFELHKQFAGHKHHGEWFNPDPEILNFIEANRGLGEPPVIKPFDGTRAWHAMLMDYRDAGIDHPALGTLTPEIIASFTTNQKAAS